MSVRSVGNVDLSIGLATCPVKMYGVQTSHDRKGSMYHDHGDGTYGKVQMPKLCADCGEVVTSPDRGFEENGEIVILTSDELESIAAATSPTVDVSQFVDKHEINPMLFANENIYRLAPDPKRGRAAATTYRMIRRVLLDEGKVGVVQYTRWGRNRLALLDVEPTDDGGVLIIRNMMWPDELRSTDGLLPEGSDSDIDPRLLPVMKEVVASMTATWNPGEHVDAYAEALNQAIEAKAEGQAIDIIQSDGNESIDDVSDLIAKLEATAAAKKAPAKKAPAKKTTARKRTTKKGAA